MYQRKTLIAYTKHGKRKVIKLSNRSLFGNKVASILISYSLGRISEVQVLSQIERAFDKYK